LPARSENFDTLWRFRPADETCPQFARGPGSADDQSFDKLRIDAEPVEASKFYHSGRGSLFRGRDERRAATEVVADSLGMLKIYISKANFAMS
jgi:hypothetical protein